MWPCRSGAMRAASITNPKASQSPMRLRGGLDWCQRGPAKSRPAISQVTVRLRGVEFERPKLWPIVTASTKPDHDVLIPFAANLSTSFCAMPQRSPHLHVVSDID